MMARRPKAKKDLSLDELGSDDGTQAEGEELSLDDDLSLDELGSDDGAKAESEEMSLDDDLSLDELGSDDGTPGEELSLDDDLSLDELGSDEGAMAEGEELSLDDDLSLDSGEETAAAGTLDDDLSLDDLSLDSGEETAAAGTLDDDLSLDDLSLDSGEETAAAGALDEDLSLDDLSLDELANGGETETALSSDDDFSLDELATGDTDGLQDLTTGDDDLDLSAFADGLDMDNADEAAETPLETADTDLGAEDELEALLSQLDTGEMPDFEDENANATPGDEISGQFDLAKMFVDMGDNDTARGYLEEILEKGSEEQKQKAQEMMDAMP